jgi:hypothetical protein
MDPITMEVDADRVRDKLKAQRNAHADNSAVAEAFAEQLFARVKELETENADLKARLAKHESETGECPE